MLMSIQQPVASDFRLLAPPSSEELTEWEAAVVISHGDFYRIAASCRLGVLPEQVTVEQRSLMKVACISAGYKQNLAFS